MLWELETLKWTQEGGKGFVELCILLGELVCNSIAHFTC